MNDIIHNCYGNSEFNQSLGSGFNLVLLAACWPFSAILLRNIARSTVWLFIK